MKNNVFNFRPKDSDLKIKRINKSKIFIAILVLVILLVVGGILGVYIFNNEFRDFWDYTILRKEVEGLDVKSIDLGKDNLKFPYAYDKQLVILEKNVLRAYNSDGNEELNLDISITNPLFSDSNRFLIIAENFGNKIYLLNENHIAWQKDLEGNISKVYVNKNGYVGVAMSSLGYKTVIVLYTPSGEELFKTYLPTTYCVDMEISNDNKFVAIAEASSSGTVIETSIKIISIENAKVKPQDAFVATYNSNSNSNNMILDLNYTDDGKLVALYDNSVQYGKDVMNSILEFNSNTVFVDTSGNNKVVSVEKRKNGLLNINYVLKIYSTFLNKNIECDLKEIPKSLYVKNDVIAISYGSNVEIVSGTSGWLIKKYVSKQEIKDVLVANNFVAIVYNDEIKIIKI